MAAGRSSICSGCMVVSAYWHVRSLCLTTANKGKDQDNKFAFSAMKPMYERVAIGDGCSVRVYHRKLPRIPFEWHHHPEYELTLTMNSRGKRYIGDSITEYGADDLVLVPPDLPHTWASNSSLDSSVPEVAIVIWFSGDWARRLGDCCPEYEGLHRLL